MLHARPEASPILSLIPLQTSLHEIISVSVNVRSKPKSEPELKCKIFQSRKLLQQKIFDKVSELNMITNADCRYATRLFKRFKRMI